eukprot:Lankesteria_metandrocarpae@DN6250_c0_g1_i1.p1
MSQMCLLCKATTRHFTCCAVVHVGCRFLMTISVTLVLLLVLTEQRSAAAAATLRPGSSVHERLLKGNGKADLSRHTEPTYQSVLQLQNHNTEVLLDHPVHERSLNVLIITHPTSEFTTSSVVGQALADRGHKVQIATFKNKAGDAPADLGFVSLGSFDDFTQLYRSALLDVQNNLSGRATIHKYTLGFLMDAARLMATSLEDHFVSQNISSAHTRITGDSTHQQNERSSQKVDVCVFSWVLELVWEPCYKRDIPIIVQNPSVFSMPFLSSSPQLPLESLFDLEYPNRMEVDFPCNGPVHRLRSLAVWAFVWILGPMLNLEVTSALRPLLAENFVRMSQSVPGFDFPVDRSPMTQYTGPIFKSDAFSPTHLSTDVLNFLNKALDDGVPVVYVSFGTLVHLERSRVYKLLEAFVELRRQKKCRLIWAHDGLPTIIANITASYLPSALTYDIEEATAVEGLLLVNWVSGPAVIAHAATRVLFSNCGSNAVHEALTFGLPVLGMPFMTDQLAVCHRIKWSKVGLTLNHFQLQKDLIVEKITQLLTEDLYHRNASHLMYVFRRYGGVAKAADLVEVVGHLGSQVADIWRSPTASLGPMRGYNLDLALFCIISAFVAGTILGRRLLLSGVHFVSWYVALFARTVIWTRMVVHQRRLKVVDDLGISKLI